MTKLLDRLRAHAETIIPATLAYRPQVPLHRDVWQTPDQDQIAVDVLNGQSPQAPVMILFHGLEGSSQSHYARQLLAKAQSLGWHAVVPHFRTCGGLGNLQARAYHAGDSQEIDWMISQVINRYPDNPRFAVGISLGGNAMLKWLGEYPEKARQWVRAAVSISAPMDLTKAGDSLDKGWNRRLYSQTFLKTLKPKLKQLLIRHPALQHRYSMEKLARIDTIRAFDDLFTAPLHGYRDVNDYWQRASSLPYLQFVTVPTLVLNARNDPFIPADSLPTQEQVSASITLDFPAHGGHAGFIHAWPWMRYNSKLPQKIFHFCQQQL
ncbi:YheT family hydrolase [Leeia oryzae]|uniref:YheT family hydrolase n=1 Tax=Leeia oryzae TaxID=356662 RepID=UPI0003658FF9|nr:alpha/beta fold hydrolase [Leeia oryzae]